MNNFHKKVRVYWNLHKKCWSIQDAKTRRVVDHQPQVLLSNCSFTVSEAGRQRVIATGHKNVHAFVVGTLEWPVAIKTGNILEVRYNPKLMETFQAEGQPIVGAAMVYMGYDKQVLARNVIYKGEPL